MTITIIKDFISSDTVNGITNILIFALTLISFKQGIILFKVATEPSIICYLGFVDNDLNVNLIIKNDGKSSAKISDIETNIDMLNLTLDGILSNRDFTKKLINATLAPSQSVNIAIDRTGIHHNPDFLEIKITYEHKNKEYIMKETLKLDSFDNIPVKFDNKKEG